MRGEPPTAAMMRPTLREKVSLAKAQATVKVRPALYGKTGTAYIAIGFGVIRGLIWALYNHWLGSAKSCHWLKPVLHTGMNG